MEHTEHETKPEGFHTEFKRNVIYIFWIGIFIAAVTSILIKYFE